MYKVDYCLTIQVVKYGQNGHYNSHHDTETHERTDVPCCHHTDIQTVQQYGKCRICRYSFHATKIYIYIYIYIYSSHFTFRKVRVIKSKLQFQLDKLFG